MAEAATKSGDPSGGVRAAISPHVIANLPAFLRERFETRSRIGGERLSIGRYVVVGELGRGGMGVVYDAWDPRIERRVAVKTVEPDLVPDDGEREEVIQRFLREIKVVGRLQHPGIIKIFDYGEEPELKPGEELYRPGRIFFYVMEYLDGRPLAKVMRERGSIPDLEAVRIAMDVAEALDVAHGLDIIHRDIKPSNIFIKENGRAVLLDFGIAKTAQPALTRAGQILGTPTYLAPERLREKEIPVDGRADIFSLGVLLYTMLVGEAPFAGENVYDLLDNIQRTAHARLSRSSRGGVALSQAVDRMLAKNREERYGDAREVVDVLIGIRRLLEETNPDVSDLASLVPVQDTMGDAATEIESASQPVPLPTPQIARPVTKSHGSIGETRPEVTLQRNTRRIPAPDIESLEEKSALIAHDPAELDEVEEADFELIDTTSGSSPTPAGTQEHPTDGRMVMPKVPEGVRQPGRSDFHERRTELANDSMLLHDEEEFGDDETLAEPEGPPVRPTRLDANEARTIAKNPITVRAAASEHSEQVTELGEERRPTRSKATRLRIEASLVDEEDVVVKPAPLAVLKPDELPTNPGQARRGRAEIVRVEPSRSESVRVEGIRVEPRPEIDTDMVRPRPVESRREAPPKSRAREPTRDRVEIRPPEEDPSKSAAVARRTFGVPARSDLPAPPPPRKSIAPPPSDYSEIRVTGSDLSPDAAVLRRRIAFSIAAALAAAAVGVMLARFNPSAPAPLPIEDLSDPPAPEVRAVATDPTDLVAPRAAEEILIDAQKAFDEARFTEANALFGRANEAAKPKSRAEVQALLGLARTAAKLQQKASAKDWYWRVLELSPTDEEKREARAFVESGGAEPEPKSP
ncbi:MAG: protein kinase [Deltaproteobacteria bacterium]|nr:protein kinase [Deltaproteobacteria bacterium]